MTSSWKTDTKRDMLTYRFIELSASLIENILVDDENDMRKYKEWLTFISGNNSEAIKMNDPQPALLSEVNPTKDSSVKLIALPNDSNFVIECKTPVFSATVSVIYDFDRYDINAATILAFDGDMVMSISWAEDFMSKLDEMRLHIK